MAQRSPELGGTETRQPPIQLHVYRDYWINLLNGNPSLNKNEWSAIRLLKHMLGLLNSLQSQGQRERALPLCAASSVRMPPTPLPAVCKSFQREIKFFPISSPRALECNPQKLTKGKFFLPSIYKIFFFQDSKHFLGLFLTQTENLQLFPSLLLSMNSCGHHIAWLCPSLQSLDPTLFTPFLALNFTASNRSSSYEIKGEVLHSLQIAHEPT